jgi:hypothetical protein
MLELWDAISVALDKPGVGLQPQQLQQVRCKAILGEASRVCGSLAGTCRSLFRILLWDCKHASFIQMNSQHHMAVAGALMLKPWDAIRVALAKPGGPAAAATAAGAVQGEVTSLDMCDTWVTP